LKGKTLMKPMLPSLHFEPPIGEEWVYETKFDGFRCFCSIDSNGVSLVSRNENSLTSLFPEIEQFILSMGEILTPLLPLLLDGEIVILDNDFKSAFGAVQIRGRMRTESKIKNEALKRPCRFLAFDLLTVKGSSISNKPYTERKEKLKHLFKTMNLPLQPDFNSEDLLQAIPACNQFEELWNQVILYDGEGIVAKQKRSIWEEGKRSSAWIKYKNWKMVSCFVIAYDKNNGYFQVGVYKDSEVYLLGSVLFGFKPDEKQTLAQFVRQNKKDEDDKFVYAPPGICLDIKYLEWYEGQLREPHFHQFRFDLTAEECTYLQFYFQQKNLPNMLEVSHPDKPIWKQPLINKMDYLYYLREISAYLLPFLKNRTLTVIRYPHGLLGEPFYQKNCPDYAPDFVKTFLTDNIDYILCNDLQTLVWLGNQLAIEFHIPFQTVYSGGPSEIVFDLDPPSKEDFPLAIRAAILIKEILTQLQLTGFIKTSGSKGLQIYIPLPENQFTYDDTRLFTSFIADFLVTKEPNLFTIERLKKNRGNRLYIDYVQHAEGKTIIAPYSARGRDWAGVAAPLFWDEVNESLRIEDFTVQNTVERVKKLGDPFKDYFKIKEFQPFEPVLQFLKQHHK
jgi:bifunctional non-homologous end joining protein LigD